MCDKGMILVMRTVRRLSSLFLILALLGNLLMPVMAYEQITESDAPAAYVEAFPVTEADGGDVLFASGDSLGTVLEGKSIMFLGDSLLTGYGLDDYRQSWCSMLEAEYGMYVTNNAITGSTISVGNGTGTYPGGAYEPMCERFLPTKEYDVIFITGGGNDWSYGIPLGEDMTSRDTSNLMGAMNVLLDRLQEKYPKAMLVYMTCWNAYEKRNICGVSLQEYNDAMVSICESRGVHCFRGDDENVSGIYAIDDAFRGQYFLSENDRWHLNTEGHALYFPVISQWLQEMMLAYCVRAGFYDVTINDWYVDAVEYAVDAGIIKGTSETSFSPNMNVQRGMLLTMLYRIAGCPDVSGLSHPFADLDPEQYYFDAVVWGYNEGITTGISMTRFAPEDELTREQLATFLYRYADGANSAYTPGDLAGYFDPDEIDDFAQDAMEWAVGCDILHGNGDGTLAPKRTATRAELVQLLANYLKSIG